MYKVNCPDECQQLIAGTTATVVGGIILTVITAIIPETLLILVGWLFVWSFAIGSVLYVAALAFRWLCELSLAIYLLIRPYCQLSEDEAVPLDLVMMLAWHGFFFLSMIVYVYVYFAVIA